MDISSRPDTVTQVCRKERLPRNGCIAHVLHEKGCIVLVLCDLRSSNRIQIEDGAPEVTFAAILKSYLADNIPRGFHNNRRSDLRSDLSKDLTQERTNEDFLSHN